jgi:hypothetical protein
MQKRWRVLVFEAPEHGMLPWQMTLRHRFSVRASQRDVDSLVRDYLWYGRVLLVNLSDRHWHPMWFEETRTSESP